MKAGFVCSGRMARAWAAGAGFIGLLVSVAACSDNGTTDPNGPRAVKAVSPDSQTTAAGVKMASPLVVLVTGAGDKPLAGVSVQWDIGTGGGSVSDSVSTTDVAGHAQTTYTPGSLPATATLTASIGTLRQVFKVVLVAGPPTTLQKFGSDNPAAVAGSVLTLSVRLVDQFANPVSNRVVNWSAAGGSIGATTSTTDLGGVASVTYTLGSDPGTYTLTATVDGVPPAVFAVKAVK